MSDRRRVPLERAEPRPHECSQERRLRALGSVPFFAGLEARDLQAVDRRFSPFGYGEGDFIYFAGEEADALYVIAAGTVKLLRLSEDGRESLLDIRAEGDFFGTHALMGRERYEETARAQSGLCVMAIPSGSFQQVLERHPAVSVAVLRFVAERLDEAHGTIHDLSGKPAKVRMARVLLRLAERLGEAGEEGILIQTPLSRADLAGLSGMAEETASRILSRFKKEGLIASGREWVAVSDIGALRDLAGAPDG